MGLLDFGTWDFGTLGLFDFLTFGLLGLDFPRQCHRGTSTTCKCYKTDACFMLAVAHNGGDKRARGDFACLACFTVRRSLFSLVQNRV